MRRLTYRVATSLDGYLAGPRGETDWIVRDASVDFGAVFEQFDTVLLGRRTYELTQQPGAPAWPIDWRLYVFSRTLSPAEHQGVTVVNGDVESTVAGLRAESGRDIWLFGGGNLFASLVALHLVDRIELAVMPVMLGQGIPWAGTMALRSHLRLNHSSASPMGIVNLRYDVLHPAG